jgi:hypothetical protein
MIHPKSHPTYKERQQKIIETDRLDFREIYCSNQYAKDERTSNNR